MTYSEELAKLLIERFGLKPQSKINWKIRGKIPSKYFDAEGKPLESLGMPESVKRSGQLILEIMSSRKLNTTLILSRCGIPAFGYADAVRKQKNVPLKQAHIIKLKQELLDLRRDIKAEISAIRKAGRLSESTTERLVKYIKSEKRLVLRSVFAGDHTNYERITHYHQRKKKIEDEAVWALVQCLEKLVLEMKIS